MTTHEIAHDPASGVFSTNVDGEVALLEVREPWCAAFSTVTGVPDAIGGRGIAGQLVRAAFEYAKAQGWHVHPRCSYAAAWVERHPEYNQVLV